MGSFLNEIKKASESSKKTIHSRKEGYDELKSACEPYIQKYVDNVKKQLLEAARNQRPVYNISKFLGKERSHSPIFTAQISFLYCFNKYILDFQQKSMYAQCADTPDTGYLTHSPDLLIYFISEINRRLNAEGIIPFYWKKTGRTWEHMRKAIPISYPTSEQRDSIFENYKKYIDKKTSVEESYVYGVSLSFKVDAE